MGSTKPSSDQDVKDVFLKEQMVCQLLSPMQLKILMNDAYSGLIRLLRGKPKTVEDLVGEYSQITEIKSEKTIYRNLNYLVDKNLVLVIGKRIISRPDQRITSLNLYARSAKFFLNDGYIHLLQDTLLFPSSETLMPLNNDRLPPLENNENRNLKETLERKFRIIHLFFTLGSDIQIDFIQFKGIMAKIFLNKEKTLYSLMKKIPIEKMELFQDLDWLEMNQLMETSLWLQIIAEKSEILTDFAKLLR